MEDKNDQKVKNNKNWLEWLVFFSSALLVLSIISYYIYLAFTFEQTEPQLRVKCMPAVEKKELTVIVYNKGGSAARNVKVEVTVTSDNNRTGKAEVSFPYVPHLSSRTGKVGFSFEPSDGDTISAHIVSFIEM